jgi:hypothetical protein
MDARADTTGRNQQAEVKGMSATHDPDAFRGWYAISVSAQKRYRIEMDGPTKCIVTVKASSRDAVIDQVKGRRIATPPGMTGFIVTEIA